MRWSFALLLVSAMRMQIRVKLGGYVELFYAYNLDRPENGVTNLRAFDDRHASFVLQNAVLEGTWTHGPVSGRSRCRPGRRRSLLRSRAAQPATGSTPARAPRRVSPHPGGLPRVGRAGEHRGRGRRVPVADRPETVAEHSVWNWSRGNLFFALPFYHTGVRLKHRSATGTGARSRWSRTAGTARSTTITCPRS